MFAPLCPFSFCVLPPRQRVGFPRRQRGLCGQRAATDVRGEALALPPPLGRCGRVTRTNREVYIQVSVLAVERYRDD